MQINKTLIYTEKSFKIPLKDNTTALIRFTHRGLKVNSFDCFQLKDKGMTRECSFKSPFGIPVSEIDIAASLAKLQLKAKKGINIFAEYTNALMSK